MKILIYIFSLSSTCFYSQSVVKSINGLPDTGEISSYTSTFGEDNDYNFNVPSFTDNLNGTVTDNITGLMWQQADGGEMTIENAIIYASNLTLGSHSDWRLPTPLESFSIMNHENNMPAINTMYFTLTAAQYWWTNTFQIGDNSKVWCTNSGGGIGNHPKLETVSAGGVNRFHVRVVRDMNPPSTFPSQFTDNANNTITDNVTNLIWQKVPNTAAFTWEQALIYAENLTLNGASDWRLPNIKELQSLNNENLTNPSVSTSIFPTIGIMNYWSSTSLPNQTTKAWFWNTIFGITSYDLKTNLNFVICVRGSSTLGIKCKKEKADFIVYPNPFTDKITVQNGVEGKVYVLKNSLDQLVFEGSDIQLVDFSLLDKGIYFLRIVGSESNVEVLFKD